MLRTSLKTVVMAIATSTLAACGSGSDSGDSTPKVTGQLPTDNIESAAEVGTVAVSGVSAGSASQQGLGYAFSAFAEDDSDYEEGIEQRRLRAQFSDSVACGQSGEIQFSGSEESVSMTFLQCVNPDGSYVSGSMQAQVSESGESGIRMSASYNDFTVTEASGDSVYINGDFRFTIANLFSGEMSIASNRFESRVTENGETESIVLANYSYNILNRSASAVESNYDFYITTAEGTYHVWSEGNLTANSNNQGLIGIVKIEGANAILTATLTSDNQSATADLSLDIDKDGTVDLTGEMTQAEFFDEPLGNLE